MPVNPPPPAVLRSAPAAAAAVLAPLTAPIAAELLAVDQLFSRELASDLACVQTLVKYVSRFRGKMLRPVLVLLTGKAAGGTTDAHTVIATVVEMVHMATLVHDDVLDDAELRRKGATINHLRGNEAAVMLGDFLISHAFHLCSSLQSQAASRAIGHTTNVVCEGELLQIDNRNNLDLTEETYFKIIERKTAALTAVCCKLGADFAGATPAVAEAMETFGRNIGTAFQIQDDLLDLTGDVAQVGKSLGADAAKGKLTLPVIHFMRTAPVQHRELLRSLLVGNEPDKNEKIRNLIAPSASLLYASEKAKSLVASARALLATHLSPSVARTCLDELARLVVAREA